MVGTGRRPAKTHGKMTSDLQKEARDQQIEQGTLGLTGAEKWFGQLLECLEYRHVWKKKKWEFKECSDNESDKKDEKVWCKREKGGRRRGKVEIVLFGRQAAFQQIHHLTEMTPLHQQP